jgi:CheY-like chemotaxis protein
MPNGILIVDDNPSVRSLIRAQLAVSGLTVCGEAVDGLDPIEKASILNPDLIVLDVSMPRMNGLDAARELHKVHPATPIVLNTLHAGVIRDGVALPDGVTDVVAKSENLVERVLSLLHKV